VSIRFENVSKAFGQKEILKDVSFTVEKGEILFILGKSGMGKSVTLKHIIGVLKPDAGKIFIDQFEVSNMHTEETQDELAKVRQLC
jgi:phospholipid/cholesterol/gamma-HCH transport system ATP-binding protein